jgi:hypothetical protein
VIPFNYGDPLIRGKRCRNQGGRPPKSEQNDDQLPLVDEPAPPKSYEETRIEEIRVRSQLYRLRLGRLSGQLVDRKLLTGELTAAFGAIREIILGSKMAQRQNEDLLRQLASIPIVLTSKPNAKVRR